LPPNAVSGWPLVKAEQHYPFAPVLLQDLRHDYRLLPVPVLGVGTLVLAVEAARLLPSRRRCGGAQILTFHMTD